MRQKLFVPSLLWLLVDSTIAETDFSQHVNVFAGTTNGGNMFPGVAAGPFASVKFGPDLVIGKAEAYAGYLPDPEASVTGFSLLHESGIGGAPKYGVVSQLPVPGSVRNPLLDLSSKRAKPDEGQIGYYKSFLSSGVTVELAATDHAGFYQYTFPQAQESSVIVDVSHVLQSFRGMNWGQIYNGGSFTIAEDGHYEGSGVYNKGWNLAPNWSVFFCGKFDQTPTLAQTFYGNNQQLDEIGNKNSQSGSGRLGGVFTFKEPLVTSRAAVSFVSAAQACQYLDSEIPAGTKLTDLVNVSKARWNSEVLSRITTTETNNASLAQLYTSLYGMHLLPSNRTGDNPGWQSTEPYYDDIFTFWDLFRCTTALMHILQPVFYEELLRSIVDVWRHEGWLPDARSSNFNGRAQGGSSADNILADAYVKGVQGKLNWADAYAAMQTDAEKVPPPNYDPASPDASTKQGRGALPDWIQFGYITPRFNRAVTRAVEYAGNDFGLHQVALGLGKNADADKYLRRSRNWRNHWNPEAESFGTKGFLVPRLANGSFIITDPMSCRGCYWRDPYYEGKPWEYSVNAHHDMERLIDLSGGAVNFTQRLNTLMDPAKKIFNAGNEPSFTTPYLYNFVGRQALSVQSSRRVAQLYNPGPGGLPGASDAGAMQSWILWNMIGLYPLTGQTTFLIGSPWFKDMTIHLGGGKSVTMNATGGDGGQAIYVQSLKVNGQPWNKNWVTWSDLFASGGSLEFELGSEQARWDTGDLPPSPGSMRQFAGDTGDAAESKAPGPQVIGNVPNGKPDWKYRIMAIVVSIVGTFVILSVLGIWICLRRIGVLKRKGPDAETDPAWTATGSKDSESSEKKEPETNVEVQVAEVDSDSSSAEVELKKRWWDRDR